MERRAGFCERSEGALGCWAKITTGRNTIAKAINVRLIALLSLLSVLVRLARRFEMYTFCTRLSNAPQCAAVRVAGVRAPKFGSIHVPHLSLDTGGVSALSLKGAAPA